MKNFIKTLFFVVPYPAAILWHLILGGFVAFLLVALIVSPAAAATYATGGIGGGLALLVGYLVWRQRANTPEA